MYKFLFFTILICVSFKGFGQDPQYSQYYNAPLYLNPAFAGTGDNTRMVINYRNQWPSISTVSPFTTTSVSFDHNIDPYKSGVGLLISHDRQGVGGLNTTDFSLLYSYQVDLNSKWSFRPGLQAGVVNRSINSTNLIFVDQIDSNGPTGTPTLDGLAGRNTNKIYPDLSAGGLLFSDVFWFGLSLHHINKPDISFANPVYQLPWKTSVQTGMRIPFGSQSLKRGYDLVNVERSILPSIHFKSQGKYKQLDLGTQLIYEPVMFGIWYRGIPIKTFEGIPGHESIILMAGLHIQKLTIGYSYDITISKLAWANSGGAHEISLIYEWQIPYPQKRKGRPLPCPKFYNKQRRTELK